MALKVTDRKAAEYPAGKRGTVMRPIGKLPGKQDREERSDGNGPSEDSRGQDGSPTRRP